MNKIALALDTHPYLLFFPIQSPKYQICLRRYQILHSKYQKQNPSIKYVDSWNFAIKKFGIAPGSNIRFLGIPMEKHILLWFPARKRLHFNVTKENIALRGPPQHLSVWKDNLKRLPTNSVLLHLITRLLLCNHKRSSHDHQPVSVPSFENRCCWINWFSLSPLNHDKTQNLNFDPGVP